MAASAQTSRAAMFATFSAFYFVIVGGVALLQMASFTRISAFWFATMDTVGLGLATAYFGGILMKQMFSPDMLNMRRGRGTPKVSNDSIRPVTLAVGYLWWAFAVTSCVAWVWWHKTGNVLKDDGPDTFDLRTVHAFVYFALFVGVHVSLVPFSVASTITARNAVKSASGDLGMRSMNVA